MYQITEQQINFILNDIRARGVQMESLQHDLLDHVCCIVENELEANGDFQHFYEKTIKSFFKNDLKEIEEETLSLLTNKNYYVMKKIMLASGVISALLLTMGIVLKFLHQQGASFGIVLGIMMFSFIFLPLMFLLKIKEKEQTRDKVLLALGSMVGILISLAILFKLQHWPYANMMGITSVGILMLIYLPINLVTGIRNPKTKINTIVSSILLVAGCGLFLALARSPQGSKKQYIISTAYFVRNDQLFRNEMKQLEKSDFKSKADSENISLGNQIINVSEELKSYLLEKETGFKIIGNDFESKQAWFGDTFSEMYFREGSPALSKLASLQQLIADYNKSGNVDPSFVPAPASATISLERNERVGDALNNLVQLELYVLQNYSR